MNFRLKPSAKETSRDYQSNNLYKKEKITDLRCGQKFEVHSKVEHFRDSFTRGDSPPKIAICSLTAISSTTSQDFAHSEDDNVNEVLVPPPLQTMSIRPAMVQPEGADEVDRLSRRKTFPSQDFAHSEDDIVNEVLVSPPLQTMSSIRSAIVQPEGVDEVDRLSRRKTFPCPAGKRSKSLKDLFEDLDVKTEDRCIRYRRRSMERRSALSMVSHPPFETKLENDGDDDEAEDPDLDAVSVEERDHSLTDGEKVLILRSLSAGLLGIQEDRSRGALWNSFSPEGTGTSKGVGLIGPTRSSFRASKRGSSLSNLGTVSSKDHTRDIMVQKRSTSVSSHMLKRGKLINEGIGSIQRNPEVLRRVSFVEDTKKGTRGSVMQVEKLLEPVSNTIFGRTTSFLGRFNAGEELKETNASLRGIGDTQSNTMSRRTSFLGLFKAGNQGEEQEENVLLESMTKRDSMNLVNALR